MSAAPAASSESRASVPRVRWGWALGIFVVGAAAVATAWALRGTTGYEWPAAVVLAGLTTIALGVWLMFFSGLSWIARFGLLALAVAGAVALRMSVRFDTFEGDMFPRFVALGTPTPEEKLREYLKSTGASAPAIAAATGEASGAPAPSATGEATAAPPAPALATSENDFPGYLGVDRKGIVTNVKLARDWSSRPPKELWRHPIGLGWSGFAIVGDLAFTQEQRDADECVVAYELATGKQRWVHADRVRFSEAMGGDGPRATPTVHGGRVYTMGATGLLTCLDGATGQLVWQQKTLAEPEKMNITWAMAGSPLVFDDLVVVSPGAGKEPSPGNGRELVAYKAADGSPAWSNGDDRTSYSSPQLSTVLGGQQILNVSAMGMSGHDPATGKKLWFTEWVTGPDYINPTQPLSLADWNVPESTGEIFLSTGYVHGCTLVKVEENAGAFTAKKLWENQNLKSKFSNYVIRDHYVFGLDEGFLVCIDLKDQGKSVWKKNRKQQYKHGQMLLVGDLLVVQAEDGYIALVAADPAQFEELGRVEALSSKTWNTLALSGNRLVARNDREAVCYELPLAE